MSETANCSVCGEPMPIGEEMFKFHGYSGPCPKPPLPREPEPDYRIIAADLTQLLLRCTRHLPEDDTYRVQALEYIARKKLTSPLRAPTP